jgi:hypothetical protein
LTCGEGGTEANDDVEWAGVLRKSEITQKKTNQYNDHHQPNETKRNETSHKKKQTVQVHFDILLFLFVFQ